MQPFSGGLVPALRPFEPEPDTMGGDQSRKDDRQLDEFVHALPVISEYQNDPQPEQDSADAEKNDSSPGGAFRRYRVAPF